MDVDDVELDVNVEELPDSDALPVAKYHFRIDDVQKSLDKKDNPFLKLIYSVIDGDSIGREVRENYVPVKGRALLKRILKAIGWKKKKLTTANMDSLIGMEFFAITKVEISEGFGEQTRIAVYIDPSGPATEDTGEPI